MKPKIAVVASVSIKRLRRTRAFKHLCLSTLVMPESQDIIFRPHKANQNVGKRSNPNDDEDERWESWRGQPSGEIDFLDFAGISICKWVSCIVANIKIQACFKCHEFVTFSAITRQKKKKKERSETLSAFSTSTRKQRRNDNLIFFATTVECARWWRTIKSFARSLDEWKIPENGIKKWNGTVTCFDWNQPMGERKTRTMGKRIEKCERKIVPGSGRRAKIKLRWQCAVDRRQIKRCRRMWMARCGLRKGK